MSQQAPSPATILKQAMQSLNASGVGETSFSGAAEWIAGSDDDTGTFGAHCSSENSSSLQLNLSSFMRTETRTVVHGMPSGEWTDNNGHSHPISQHNALSPASWFCPHLSVLFALADPLYSVQYLGQTSRDKELVDDFLITRISARENAFDAWMSGLSDVHVLLDSMSLRPAIISFNQHPDSDATFDMPVEVHFSDYALDKGVWMPMTIEKYVNGTLTLRLKVDPASVTSAPTIQ
jgi:hypothetical protein